jgi:hypothetical protein
MTTPPAASVPPQDDVILTGLRAAYPGWNIHRGRDGRWLATAATCCHPPASPRTTRPP